MNLVPLGAHVYLDFFFLWSTEGERVPHLIHYHGPITARRMFKSYNTQIFTWGVTLRSQT